MAGNIQTLALISPRSSVVRSGADSLIPEIQSVLRASTIVSLTTHEKSTGQ